jgi:hypothetical protein
MGIPPKPTSSKPWQDLVRQSVAEAPPEIDVRFSVRSRIESERLGNQVPREPRGVLDDMMELVRFRSVWAAVAAIAILLGWQMVPELRELYFAIQLQGELLAGL